MTIADLIDYLQDFDGDLEVIVSDADGGADHIEGDYLSLDCIM